jgi:hypothetical protein
LEVGRGKILLKTPFLNTTVSLPGVDREIVGFAITDQTFYGQTFIWLLIVTPEHRRKGVAVGLV